MSRASAPTRRRKVVQVAPRADRLRLRWSISPEAAAAAGWAERSPVLEVCVAFPGAVRSVSAWIMDGDARRPIPAGRVNGEWLRHEGLWHLDLPGMLVATVRQIHDGVQPLFTRTDLPRRLGIGGGRFELEGASLIEA